MPTPKAVLFGAIGTLVETSDMQRRSFNAAFADAGLDWAWGREAYAEMLKTPGGVQRIADYAEQKGQEVDAELIHKAKVAHFRERVLVEGLALRPGVADVISGAQDQGITLGFATSTGAGTVDLIFEGLEGKIARQDFAFIGDRDMVTQSKPSSEIYRVALQALGMAAGDVLAIEDTPESAQSAIGAGVNCIGFPGNEVRDRSFPPEVLHVVEHLELTLMDLHG